MSKPNFVHLVEIDEASKKLMIYRLFNDGKRHLYTSTTFPENRKSDPEGFKNFCLMLGENLIFDSPAARKILDI